MSKTTISTIIGVFPTHAQAETAIRELKQAGFNDKQVGFLVRSTSQTSHTDEQEPEGAEVATSGILGALLGAAEVLLLPVTGPTDANNIVTSGIPLGEEVLERLRLRGHAPPPGASASPQTQHPATPTFLDENTASIPDSETHGARDEGVGVITGGVLGGVLGAAVAFLIPGIGPVVAGGILVSALGGAAMGAATGGAFGAFVGLGIPEKHARHYSHELEKGRAIVTIQASTRVDEAVSLLKRTGAHDVEVHPT